MQLMYHSICGSVYFVPATYLKTGGCEICDLPEIQCFTVAMSVKLCVWSTLYFLSTCSTCI